jgi:drug/metabolite transporter (DMT)-like permease
MTAHIAPQTRPLLPYAALGIGILSLSLSAMFIRWATAPGPITGFYRIFFAVILLAPFFLWRSAKKCAVNSKNIIFPILGGIASGCDLGLWSTSLSYTTASNATLIGNTAPLWVALAGLLIFRERLQRDFWIGLILTMSGAVLIMGSDFILHPRFGLGDLMALGTSCFYAGYFLATERGRKFLDPLTYTWLMGLSAAITLFIINLLLKNAFTGYSTSTWLIFLSSAIVSQVIGYLSMTYALGHLPASIVSPTMIGQPVLTTLLAIPLLGEIPFPIQIVGGIIALTGIYLVNQAHSKTSKNCSPNSLGTTGV